MSYSTVDVEHYEDQTYTKAKRSRTFIAFNRNVSPGSQKIETNIDGTLESETQSALAENNLYKTSDHLLQKGKIP